MMLVQDHMMGFLLGAVLLVLVLGYTGAPYWLWTIGISGILFIFCAPKALLFSYLAISFVFIVRPLRTVLVSSFVMKIMKAMNFVPQISETERTALDAGVVWVESDLFSGKPDFKKLSSESYPDLTEEEQAFLDGPVEELCEMIDDWKVWKDKELPVEVWNFLKEKKFLGMIIPKKYGGLEFSALAHSHVIKKLASRSVPATITVMVPNSLGPAELLSHFGTQAQKEHYLPRLADGREMPCFALTEPRAGSDAGALQATGVLFKDTDGTLKVKLNWNKRWITLAAISTTLGLAFRLKDPDNLLGKGENVGITCALIPTHLPGVVLGRRHDPMGVPFYNCPTQGHDVVISADQIIGGVEMAGKGWAMLMDSLGAGRGISLPAQTVGGAKTAYRLTSAHSVVRKQFGLSIGKFEGIEEPLARIGGYTYLLEAFRRYTLGALNQGIKPPVITAIAKYQSTELGRKVVNDAMDILGGAGISRGPRNIISGQYMSAPIGITVEGANILTRTLMIFGQGALRAHPYAYQEVKAVEENNVSLFDQAFWGHIGHVVRNAFRATLLSLTRGRLASAPHGGPTKRYYQKLAWASASFAILSDVAMGVLGGKLKQKEMITGRFADILSWMYIGVATLRRFEAEGQRKEDLPFLHYAMRHANSEIQKGFDGIFSNLKVPMGGWLFGGIIKIWSWMNPINDEISDDLKQEVASLMLQDSEQRDRFTDGIFIPKSTDEALGRLDHAFKLTLSAEQTERKIRKAIRGKQLPKKKTYELLDEALEKGVITQSEFDDIKKAEDARWDAIQVDDFSQEEFLEAGNDEGSPVKQRAKAGK